MKTAQVLLLAMAVLAATAGFATATSRKLQEVTIVSNLDPLDTYDVVQENGRTFVRVVDSPLFGEEAERDGTVFGALGAALLKMVEGGLVGMGAVGEAIAEEVRESPEPER
eukprot:evm.model.scf_2046.1 EVM.evm.TU.scf_2046.1   scf_2046:6997-10858(-)